jgi:hypothetical protein
MNLSTRNVLSPLPDTVPRVSVLIDGDSVDRVRATPPNEGASLR